MRIQGSSEMLIILCRAQLQPLLKLVLSDVYRTKEGIGLN